MIKLVIAFQLLVNGHYQTAYQYKDYSSAYKCELAAKRINYESVMTGESKQAHCEKRV